MTHQLIPSIFRTLQECCTIYKRSRKQHGWTYISEIISYYIVKKSQKSGFYFIINYGCQIHKYDLTITSQQFHWSICSPCAHIWKTVYMKVITSPPNTKSSVLHIFEISVPFNILNHLALLAKI